MKEMSKIMEKHFRALVLNEQDGQIHAAVQDVATESLPAGDVTIAVAFSSMNYKDALAVTNVGKIVRSFPMAPGIDLAGTVVESQSPQFKPGDQVLVTGWGIGERHWGGYSQLARVRSEWVVPVPSGMSLHQAMGIGTAGFTAMLCVMALEEHGLRPGSREIVVTGAGGGVGSVAVALLAERGYTIAASTGRAELHEYLTTLGAASIVSREEIMNDPKRPLSTERWGGAVDTVGGQTLSAVIRSLAYGASAAACGLAGGSDVPLTVMPFILRGVSLLGIDSVMCPPERRITAWQRLAQELSAAKLDQMVQTIALADVPVYSQQILHGQVRGRIVVDVNA